MNKLNWDRGLFRVWLAGSLLWGGWCVLTAINHWNYSVDLHARYQVEVPGTPEAINLALGTFVIWTLPSMLALVLGRIVLRGLAWIAAGFSK
jgi:hypothetical protein